MNCIIIDDEPLAREATQMLIDQAENLNLIGSFNSPEAAKNFIEDNTIELIFLDIEMPGINGIDFAQGIPKETFVVFITAYSDFATGSYEVDAIDYLMKPVKLERFKKAVEKVENYSKLIQAGYANNDIKKITDDFFYVKADRKIFKLYFDNVFFIQGLKDYVVMHTDNQRVITAMNIKTIQDQLPKDIFVRVSKSYIINVKHIDAVDNNTVYIGTNEIPIGNIYRDFFFKEFVTKKILTK